MVNDSSDPTKAGPAPPTSPQYREERERLAPELRPVYDALVESYRFHAFVQHRQPFVSYKVLAGLVQEGWRLRDAAGRQPSTDAFAAGGRSKGEADGAGS